MPHEGRPISWGFVFFGVVFLVLAWWLHGVFTNMETQGGSIRINWMFALLYKALGKWGVTGAISLIGAGMVWFGLKGGEDREE